MHPLDQFAQLAPVLGGVVAGISPDQLDAPTPCAGFDVRGVLEHMIGGATVFAAAYRGEAEPPAPDVEDPVGGDLDPVDVSTAAGRLTLSAYVWPDQAARWERLRAALALAAAHPPTVRRVGAAHLLDELVKSVDPATVRFGKRFVDYVDQGPDEALLLRFGDGTTATADASELFSAVPLLTYCWTAAHPNIID